MQINFELVRYDEALNKFDLDETIHRLDISDEDALTYELLKSSDLNLYNWFRESESFKKYVSEEIYPESKHTKIAISEINDATFRRFYFFKVTSSDTHYEYFKKLFNIFEESDWQDREEIGLEILDHLAMKRQELIIDLSDHKTAMNDTDRS